MQPFDLRALLGELAQDAAVRPALFRPGTFELVAGDATMLEAADNCLLRFFFAHIVGLRTKRERVALKAGSLMHMAAERYAVARAWSGNHDAALGEAVAAYAGASRGWQVDPADDPARDRLTVLRTLVWYLDAHRDDVLHTTQGADGRPMVEQNFHLSLPIPTTAGSRFVYAGYWDRVIETTQVRPGRWVLDIKTTKNNLGAGFFAKFQPGHQTLGYCTAGAELVGAKGMIIDGIQIARRFARWQRGFVEYGEAQRREWLQKVEALLGRIADASRKGWWEPNLAHCWLCPFKRICATQPESRGFVIETEFERGPRWNPLVPRAEQDL